MAGKNKGGTGGGSGRGIQQNIPPYGIKTKIWRRKTPSSHSPTYHGDGGGFSITCPSCRESFAVGVKAPKFCHRCHRPLPQGGYVDA